MHGIFRSLQNSPPEVTIRGTVTVYAAFILSCLTGDVFILNTMFKKIAVRLPATIQLSVRILIPEGIWENSSGTAVNPIPIPTAHAIIRRF